MCNYRIKMAHSRSGTSGVVCDVCVSGFRSGGLSSAFFFSFSCVCVPQTCVDYWGNANIHTDAVAVSRQSSVHFLGFHCLNCVYFDFIAMATIMSDCM